MSPMSIHIPVVVHPFDITIIHHVLTEIEPAIRTDVGPQCGTRDLQIANLTLMKVLVRAVK